ncbi:MAG: prephenate dehydratase domain-containing protein, partial [Oscillospiraceae bacterium]
AKYVAESETEGIAAICSREAAEKYGLTILAERIQDDQNNRTRFVVVSKNPLFTQNANKISLCFSLPNATGSLYRVLERFALSGLNLTKIESRPIRGSNFQYDFYLDFNGNIKEENVMQLISTLKDELPHFSFLGNYREM